MRKLATIEIIRDIQAIPKADNIELVFIKGWQCVAKKGEFKVLDHCVYFEVDSRLPIHPVFAFMEKRKFKVKTIKCMKQLSQGLALPVGILGNFVRKDFSVITGADVTDIIGVTKIDAEGNKIQIEKMRDSYPWWKKLMLRYKFTRNIVKSWERKLTFPSDIVQKTDEERWQNLTLSRVNYLNKNLEITEKLDGQSATYIYRPNFLKEEFMVCSRNQLLKNPDNSSWWSVARKYAIIEKLRMLHKHLGLGRKCYVILQGEILGMGIQKNKYKVSDFEFYVFNLRTSDKIGTKRYSYIDVHNIFLDLNILLNQVPIVTYTQRNDVEELNEIIEKIGCFKSKKNKEMWAEGIVVRAVDEQSLSFKYINPKFLLKHDE